MSRVRVSTTLTWPARAATRLALSSPRSALASIQQAARDLEATHQLRLLSRNLGLDCLLLLVVHVPVWL